MKFQAVVFDWAGTTMDYGCFSPLGAFVEAFSQQGLDISIEDARKPMGLLKIDHIRSLLAMPHIARQFVTRKGYAPREEDIEELYRAFEKSVFSVLGDYASLNPFVLEAVEALSSKGLKIGSTTGYTREMMDVLLPLAKAQGYAPSCCIASDELGYGRPYPYMMYENARRLGIYPMSSIIKVGDTVVDMQEGRNAGCLCIGVVLGSSILGLSKEEVSSLPQAELESKKNAARVALYQAGADRVIDDLSELANCLCELESSPHRFRA